MDVLHILPDGYKIRKFTEIDLDRVVEINRICLPENYSSLFFLELYRSFPDTFVVGEYNGWIVGYTMCRIESGFSELKRFRFTRKGHIVSVAVMPEHRCKGIAFEMLTQALKNMTERYKCSETYLEVRVSNQAAINLYKKMGFKITRTISKYYFDGEDAVVMCRLLPFETADTDKGNFNFNRR